MDQHLPPSAQDVAADARHTARQRRRVAAFVCLPGALLGLVTLAGAQALGAFDDAPQPTCPVTLVTVPTRGSFEVTVLNGSGTTGMAHAGAAALTRAGFRVVSKGNAKETDWTDLPAVISHGPAGLAQAQVVAALIPGSRLADDGRAGTAVEVTVGTAFSPRLNTNPAPDRMGAHPRSAAGRSVGSAQPGCTPGSSPG